MATIHPQYVVDPKGKRRSVLLSVKEFEKLLECAQDVMDTAEIDKLRQEPRFLWSRVKADRKAGRRQ